MKNKKFSVLHDPIWQTKWKRINRITHSQSWSQNNKKKTAMNFMWVLQIFQKYRSLFNFLQSLFFCKSSKGRKVVFDTIVFLKKFILNQEKWKTRLNKIRQSYVVTRFGNLLRRILINSDLWFWDKMSLQTFIHIVNRKIAQKILARAAHAYVYNSQKTKEI